MVKTTRFFPTRILPETTHFFPRWIMAKWFLKNNFRNICLNEIKKNHVFLVSELRMVLKKNINTIVLWRIMVKTTRFVPRLIMSDNTLFIPRNNR